MYKQHSRCGYKYINAFFVKLYVHKHIYEYIRVCLSFLHVKKIILLSLLLLIPDSLQHMLLSIACTATYK